MPENKKAGTNWVAIIIGVLLYLLILAWNNQRVELEKNNQTFAQQTAITQYQQDASISKTLEVEEKTSDCLPVNQVPLNQVPGFQKYYQCVYGFIGLVKESTEPKLDSYEPTLNKAYFDSVESGFYLHSDVSLDTYVNRCVKAWGKISVMDDGTPTLFVTDGREGLNLEILPESSCY